MSAQHERVDTPETQFGLALREARLEAGLSQEELSFRADVHTNYVSLLERGRKSPTLGVIVRLAEALSLEPEALVAAMSARLRLRKRRAD